ncbi:2-oxoglutarate dehydrogenase, E2 subunit, dihydrolipoamide succinyltransferase [Geobacter metallireducens RCH3]|uniref:Dihydrolipoyllysine-residue succinyltransferase component of 2-oxoglutarate dehydrogenase complex n=1 Tax=Geobacter metallireducens (strain ATCC 53774 / DSM 7210 / GS-15) TaxID=269799 RepID=Q39RZ0_GEOMG|nr:2-oxoglutarate dehydrogenase complex dihydrolipoyllysine-residue succinyltransferase [Geobacter metallireducens]ABB32984.1 2-oxoglutarate dehydrogenase, E2 protein, dihydrolipoamide succinyltransferase [Geobacter metallireducens GS-15]EHP88882.1 2-oxoglutarate dehydrogenase, E2 subunit, dihydrolipoamide succinyltransferase [Geobacter metallireducens RCH3]
MEIKVPSVGESVYEALVGKWLKKNGEAVRKDEPVCEIETDKITMEIDAGADGVLTIMVPEGATVKIGSVIGIIEAGTGDRGPGTGKGKEVPPLSPAVRKIAQELGIKPETVHGSGRGGRVTVDDLLTAGTRDLTAGTGDRGPGTGKGGEVPKDAAVKSGEAAAVGGKQKEFAFEPVPGPRSPVPAAERVTRSPMTPIRKRIAERLLVARQQTAMLTTFNEADLGRVMELRKKYKEHFQKKHGVSLGFMSFFVKACVEALKEYPAVNGSIEGDDIVFHHYYHIGIAIGAEKGLVVPVLRDADRLSFAEIETTIAGFAEKTKANRLELSDLQGGTFTISNGGVYGSLLSTPILNPPQSGVLGMHAVQERPVVRDGQIVIRPMMYLALSYDHRIIDGREAVGFLKKVKEYVEEPEELFLEG